MLLQQLLTVNRLLIRLQKFAEIWCSARDLCPALVAAWVGGWVLGCQTPPPPPMGVGHFWVLGFSQNLGGWVLKFTPPPPVTTQIPGLDAYIRFAEYFRPMNPGALSGFIQTEESKYNITHSPSMCRPPPPSPGKY